jgi:hypothetical protein
MTRLAFPLVLEGSAAIFFEKMVDLSRRAKFDKPLKYFAPLHQEAEAAHEVFSDASHTKLASLEFDAETYATTIAMVDRSFAYFEQFADHLEQMRRNARAQPSSAQ